MGSRLLHSPRSIFDIIGTPRLINSLSYSLNKQNCPFFYIQEVFLFLENANKNLCLVLHKVLELLSEWHKQSGAFQS